jgi:hypothetical protein
MGNLARPLVVGACLVGASAVGAFVMTDRFVVARAPDDSTGRAHRARTQSPFPDRQVRSPALKSEKLQSKPTATISGQVLDHESGAPIPGAQVYFGRGDRATTTDAEGSFTLPGLPTGKNVRLKVEKQGEYLADVIDVKVPIGAVSVRAETARLVRGHWQARFAGGPAGLVGINHELKNGKVHVTSVRAGTPAAQAGIQIGDRLVTVDGKPMDGLGHRARSFLLMGRPGTDVVLMVEAPTGGTRSVTLRRYAGQGLPGYPFAERQL